MIKNENLYKKVKYLYYEQEVNIRVKKEIVINNVNNNKVSQ